MRLLLGWAAGTALLVLALDQSLKTFVRTHLLPCSVPTVVVCDRAELGSLWLLRASNAGSAMGLGQGWWVWVLLACSGVLLILLYARWLNDRGWLAGLAIGLQLGGALSNLLDRLVLGGATDVLYAGWGPIWNLADIAIGIGTVVATWRFVRNIPRPV